MVSLITIHKKDLFNVKIEIYHQKIRVITKNKCNNKYSSNKFPGLYFENWLDIIALESATVEGLLMMCTDENVWKYHLIIANKSVDYKE